MGKKISTNFMFDISTSSLWHEHQLDACCQNFSLCGTQPQKEYLTLLYSLFHFYHGNIHNRHLVTRLNYNRSHQNFKNKQNKSENKTLLCCVCCFVVYFIRNITSGQAKMCLVNRNDEHKYELWLRVDYWRSNNNFRIFRFKDAHERREEKKKNSFYNSSISQ